MERIFCNNLTVSYHRHPVVHHLNVEFKTGHTNAIIGPNGAGKSTLLKTLLGEIKPDDGQVIIEKISKDKIAYLPQVHDLDCSIPFTVNDLLCLGLMHTIGISKGINRSFNNRIAEALTQIGLPEYQYKYINELSKGQLQRVLMAKIIIQNANVIILDEPFNAMDSKTTTELLKLIHIWRTQNKTIIAVLHDIQQVINHFEYTLLLAHELIAFGKTKEVINKINLEKAYKSNYIEYNMHETCDN